MKAWNLFLRWVKSFFEPFPNSEEGMLIAKNFLTEGIELVIGEKVTIVSLVQNAANYHPQWKGTSGPIAMLDVFILVTFTTDSSAVEQSVFAQLCLACESGEHHWYPNYCGSYLSFDRNNCYHLQSDFYSGKVSIGKEWYGSNIPEDSPNIFTV